MTGRTSSLFQDIQDGLREELVRALGRHRYRLWFRDTSVVDVSEHALRLAVPTDVHRAWMEFTFADELGDACQRLLGEGVRVELEVCPTQDEVRRVRDALPQGTGAWRRLVKARQPAPTFANYRTGPSGRFPQLLLRKLVHGGGADSSPIILLYGDGGSGKTHLLRAFDTEVAQGDPSACLYITANELTNRFVAALRMRNVAAVRALEMTMTSRKFVLIDNLDALDSRAATQRELVRILDDGIANGTRFLLASREHPLELEGLSERLRSRLLSGVVTPLRACADESLTEMLRDRAAASAVGASDELLQAITQDTSCVAGAVEIMDRWVAASVALGRPLEVRWLPEISPGVSMTAQEEVIRRVKDVVANHFAIPRPLLDQPTKVRRAAFPRRVAMYLVYRACALPLGRLGESFGLRSHSSVSRAIHEVRDLRQTDADVDQLVDGLLTRV